MRLPGMYGWIEKEEQQPYLTKAQTMRRPDQAKGALPFLLMSRRQVKVQDCLGAKKRTYK